MIIYFSASGNSKAVADRLGKLLDERVMNLVDTVPSELEMEGESLGFVFPIYSWGTPPIVSTFISNLNSGMVDALAGRPIWMVCTCGDDVAMAPEMFKRALKDVGLRLSGGWSIQMPNTYVLLPGFSTDPHDLENKKLREAYVALDIIADKIRNKEWEESYVRGSLPRIKSGIVFPLFKRWGVFPSRWHATEACIGCARCESVCPTDNISMVNTADGFRPRWGKDCISCLACYHVCPCNAVQYGSVTKGKGQYRFIKWPLG